MTSRSRFRRDMLAEFPFWVRIGMLVVAASVVVALVYGDGPLYWTVRIGLWVAMIYLVWTQRGKAESAKLYSSLSRVWAGLLGGAAGACAAGAALLAAGVIVDGNGVEQLAGIVPLTAVAVLAISWPEIELRMFGSFRNR